MNEDRGIFNTAKASREPCWNCSMSCSSLVITISKSAARHIQRDLIHTQ
jgi:hypothetical protein